MRRMYVCAPSESTHQSTHPASSLRRTTAKWSPSSNTKGVKTRKRFRSSATSRVSKPVPEALARCTRRSSVPSSEPPLSGRRGTRVRAGSSVAAVGHGFEVFGGCQAATPGSAASSTSSSAAPTRGRRSAILSAMWRKRCAWRRPVSRSTSALRARAAVTGPGRPHVGG